MLKLRGLTDGEAASCDWGETFSWANALNEARLLRDFFSVPGRWIQYTAARTIDRREVGPYDPEAAMFCLGGGMCKVADGCGSAFRVFDKLSYVNGYTCYVNFNDHAETTYEMILEFLNLAVQACERMSNVTAHGQGDSVGSSEDSEGDKASDQAATVLD